MKRSKKIEKPKSLFTSWREGLFSQTDAASLGAFRICFGIVVAYDLLKFVLPGSVDFKHVFEVPGWNFPYPGFEWITALSPVAVKCIFGIGGIAAVLFTLGLFTRLSAVLMFLGYNYFFLIDSAHYNNHYYLISLLCFLAIWLPFDKRFALRIPLGESGENDGCLIRILRKCGLARDNSPDAHLIPHWPIFLLRMQLLVVYLFGAIAKLNADWFTGEPIIGNAEVFEKQIESLLPFMSSVEPITYAIAMAWIGLIFDFAIGFILMIPRTQLLGIGLLACFHGINHLTLPIGVFPFLGFSASFIFLAPNWPLQLWAWIRKPRLIAPDWRWFTWGAILLPGIGGLLGWKLNRQTETNAPQKQTRFASLAFGFVIIWTSLQFIIPLRHFTISGDPSWTEEGQFFAWRMMLRQKSAGNLTLHLHDSGIYVKDSQERLLDWSTLSKTNERAIYIPVDASRFDWRGNKGLNNIYEGIVGYRIVQAVKGNTEDEIGSERKELENWWELKTGEKLIIKESRPLTACLISLRYRLKQIEEEKGVEAVAKEKLILLDIFKHMDGISSLPQNLKSERIATIHDYLSTLLESDYRKEILSELELVDPFSIIGVEPPKSQKFWILAQRDDSVSFQALCDSLGRGTDYLIWCDFGRLRFHQWKGLPEWLPVFEGGRLTIMWNYFEELSLKQIQQLSIRPHLIWQYAQRIAKKWENDFGRRPAVYGYGSVMMNYRYPASLIDPNVDLAAAKYSFIHHNEWIMPFKSERMGISERLKKSK